jgi:hypothetical protein
VVNIINLFYRKIVVSIRAVSGKRRRQPVYLKTGISKEFLF